MADTNTVDTGIASDESFGVSMDSSGVETTYEDGGPIDVADAETDGDLDQDTDGAEQEDSGEDSGEDSPALEDLGDFDPNDTEKWDAQYKTEDGTINEAALSAEFWKNGKDGDNYKGLNEGTYKYLESLGISRQTAKNVEAALVTKQDADAKAAEGTDAELFTLAGGPDKLKAALDWGKAGGYTPEQRAKFDKVMKGKDKAAKAEAVELLIARHGKANPTPAKEKPRLPQRDATKGRGQPAGTQPFANREEYRAARTAAGNNQAARRQVAERLARSSF